MVHSVDNALNIMKDHYYVSINHYYEDHYYETMLCFLFLLFFRCIQIILYNR